jgi:hypothetical protein
VTIKALLGPRYTTQAQAALELVPALLNQVTLNTPTMIGTKGTTISCTAELKAPAPAGGIELYMSPLVFSPSFAISSGGADRVRRSFQLDENPRVAAGSKTVTFPIRYNDLVSAYSSFQFSDQDFSTAFETQTRRVELVLALDPQTQTATWQPIPNRAIKVGFDLVPLKVNSFSVQPSSLASGAEAVATFVLNAAPGSNETVIVFGSPSTALRAVLLGSSCQAAGTSAVELPLTSGATSHSFKVCARTVTSATPANAKVGMRSGQYTTSVTVQP